MALLIIMTIALVPVEVAPLASWNDKLNHIMAFAVITMLVDFSWPKQSLNVQKIILILTYGGLIELLQSLTAYRTASLEDLLADGIGIILYSMAVPLIRRLPYFGLRWRL